MTGEKANASLHDSLDRFLRRHPDLDGRALLNMVEQVVERQSVPAAGPGKPLQSRLREDAQDLAEVIRRARADIAALNPEAITEEHLPVAGEELEAIVSATETATHEIMEAAEAIEASLEPCPPDAAESISNAVTRIFEACSFQDITGQRISKVVNALQQVEAKVGNMLATLGGQTDEVPKAQAAQPAQEVTAEDRERALMNGPQSVEQAPSQDDIDALFQKLG